ncbi:MAG: hypothetical protein P1U67_11715 [Alcanivoracaceae bacterium]|nr:hypothetical protein [Alcanivoracaceae bacterium]
MARTRPFFDMGFIEPKPPLRERLADINVSIDWRGKAIYFREAVRSFGIRKYGVFPASAMTRMPDRYSVKGSGKKSEKLKHG